MRFIFLLTLVLLLGCSSSVIVSQDDITYGQAKVTIPFDWGGSAYTTPYGVIYKGDSRDDVKYILGEPYHVSKGGRGENWWYYFAEDERITVYFLDGKVCRVEIMKDKEV
ncbi:MAG: hypothetical protein P9L96_04290 [Candidatus Gygaella obscura]|nr:hypothetical protein [Candidatus Gygaella obscura]